MVSPLRVAELLVAVDELAEELFLACSLVTVVLADHTMGPEDTPVVAHRSPLQCRSQ